MSSKAPDTSITALSLILLIIPFSVLDEAETTPPKRSFMPSTIALIALLAGMPSLPRF